MASLGSLLPTTAVAPFTALAMSLAVWALDTAAPRLQAALLGLRGGMLMAAVTPVARRWRWRQWAPGRDAAAVVVLVARGRRESCCVSLMLQVRVSMEPAAHAVRRSGRGRRRWCLV